MRLILKTYKRILSHKMFLVISQCTKSLVKSTQKPDKFMQLFSVFVGVPK